jgi:ABC-type branched-subunit amino acid transport system substrate-binding protein
VNTSRRILVMLVAACVLGACAGSKDGGSVQRAAQGAPPEVAATGGPSDGAPTADGAAPATDAAAQDAAAAGSPTASGAASGQQGPGDAARPATPLAKGASAPATGSGKAGSGGASGPASAASAGPGQPGPAVPGQPGPGEPGSGAPTPGGENMDTDVGVTGSSIKVGHIGIYSGPVGSFGDDLSYACRATLQSVNDNGGINGRKLDVLVRDDGWDGTKGMNAARDLAEREKVFGFACIQSVSTSDPLTPYADSKKIPNVGGDGAGEPQYEGQWSFPTAGSNSHDAHQIAEYQAVKQGARKVGILHWNNATGKAYLDAYRMVMKQHGGDVVVSQAASFDDPGTTTFIAQCRAQGCDAISTEVDPGIFARMVREAAAQGYKPKHGFSGASPLYFEVTPSLTGPHGEGTITATHFTPNDQDTPGFRTYKQTVERYYPKIDHSTWTKNAFMGGNLFANVIRKLGVNVTRQRVKDDLDTLTGFDLGLGAQLTFRPGSHRANKTVYLVQLQKTGDKLGWKTIAGPIQDQYSK